MQFLGFDPGGEQAFGWAVFAPGAPPGLQIATGTCSSSADAVAAASRLCKAPPAAVGVDAPLFWCDQGDRRADATVRKMVCANGGSSGTVSHVNSLRGACLVQGVLVARAALAAWPGARLTEAHPKALLRVSSEARSFVEQLASAFANEHERDAALAAFSALQMCEGSSGWTDLTDLDPGAHQPSGVRAAYWFPRTAY